jgi:urea transporter
MRLVANIALGVALGILLVSLVADAIGAIDEGARDGFAIAGLALLAVAQALRAYLDRSPRPLIVLGFVVVLLVVLLFDVG